MPGAFGFGRAGRVSEPDSARLAGAFGQTRESPVPEPAGARALGRLVGEPVGKADRLDLQERPPGGTERAEGAF